MSACLNKVSLIGYLGADPEIRQTGDGKKVSASRHDTPPNAMGVGDLF